MFEKTIELLEHIEPNKVLKLDDLLVIMQKLKDEACGRNPLSSMGVNAGAEKEMLTAISNLSNDLSEVYNNKAKYISENYSERLQSIYTERLEAINKVSDETKKVLFEIKQAEQIKVELEEKNGEKLKLLAEKNAIEKRINELSNPELENIEQNIVNLKQDLEIRETDFRNKKAEEAMINSSINARQNEINIIVGELQKAKVKLSELEQEANKSKIELTNTNTKNEELKEQLIREQNELRQSIQDLKNWNTNYQEENKKLNLEYQNSNSKFKTIKNAFLPYQDDKYLRSILKCDSQLVPEDAIEDDIKIAKPEFNNLKDVDEWVKGLNERISKLLSFEAMIIKDFQNQAEKIFEEKEK